MLPRRDDTVCCILFFSCCFNTYQYFTVFYNYEERIIFIVYYFIVKLTYKTGFSKIVVITRLFWGDALVLQVSIGQLVWNCFLARKIALSFGLSTASLSTTAVPKNITIFKVGGLDVARGPVRGAHVR